MTDLGVFNYFLGVSATRSSTSLFLSQKKYACELLERANMVNCNPLRTPVDTDSKLGPEGVAVQDPTLYRCLAGGLQYLTFTRPDLSYVVQHICLYMHDPREPHFVALKRIFRYVRGTVDFGLLLYASFTTSLVGTEAEYHGVANVVAETAWLRNLLRNLHSPLSITTLWERTLRDSIKNDCVKVYEIEKKKLKNYLKGHFVDSNWRLQKRVLSFIHLPPPRRVKFMKEKFDKYWKECNLLMSVAAVLDLRCKMTVAKFIFPRMYSGDELKVNIKIVVHALSELYKEY
nr:ribonuclease H-like domain-containing protein [Tanacetum cinerariifolium]